MELNESELRWLEFDLLSEYSHVKNAAFSRHGGSSQGAYATLNLSSSVGDHPDCVKVNRALVQKFSDVAHLVVAKQVHGNEVFEVTSDNLNEIKEADALFTKEKDIALLVTHADCQAAVFFDKKMDFIGIAHAGWKGLVSNIYAEMIDVFLKNGSNISDIIVCISPSIGRTKAEFKNYKNEFPESFFSFQKEPFHFDLREIAHFLLREKGILEENIEIVDICTYQNPKDYFSYRRDKITGRNATLIALKK